MRQCFSATSHRGTRWQITPSDGACRYGVRLVVVAGVALMITEQYLQPTIANSLVPLRQLNWPHMIERVLKLSLPTLYGWLLIFYALFHLWCAARAAARVSPAALPVAWARLAPSRHAHSWHM